MRIIAVCGIMGLMVLQPPTMRLYRDPAGRFTFSYPSSFGSTSTGTNDGFQDRVAAVGFSTFPARFKGEAVLTRGFPLFDLQAVGGLYDGLTLEIFPAALRALVVRQLPRLSATNLCEALERPRHLDPNLAEFASLPPPQRESISQVDVMRNANPRLVECRTDGDVVVFDKQRSFRDGDPVQHVYGAVRFLPAPFSTFQVIAGGDPPRGAILTALADLVTSFKTD
jgi:hypothetical protein